MKLLRISLSIIAVFLLLLIVAVIALPQLIDPNDYKTEISQTVEEHTGLKLAIQGNLSLSVFPWIGIKTGALSLAQPSDIASSGNIVDIKQANIKVKLKPLFSREIQIDTILLKTPRIHIIVKENGYSSIDSVLAQLNNGSEPPSQNSQTTPSTPPTESANSSNTSTSPNSQSSSLNPTNPTKKSIAAIAIAGIDISNGSVIYDDRSTKTLYQLNELTINSGDPLNDKRAPLHISGQVTENKAPLLSFAVDTQLHFDLDTLKADVHSLEAQLKHTLANIDLNLNKVSIDQATQKIALELLSIQAQMPEQPNVDIKIPAINIELDKKLFDVPQFTVDTTGVNVTGNTLIDLSEKMSFVRGMIKTNTFNAKALLEKFKVDYSPSNADALNSVNLSSKFNATPNGVSLRKMILKLDKSTINSDVSIVHFEKPEYVFDINLDSINIDDYLPESDPSADAANDSNEPISAGEVLAAPIALLQDIYANGTFRAGSIIANKMTLSNTVVAVKSTKQKTIITPKVELYDGQLNGTITLKKQAKPQLLINTQLSNINLKPLLSDAEVTEKFSGIGNITTQLTATDNGNSGNDNKVSTKGTIRITAENGALEGVNLKEILDNGQNIIDKARGKSVADSTSNGEDSTQFAAMSATLLINNDIITNNDLSAEAPASRIGGKGTVNLASQTIDYLALVSVVNTNSGQGGDNLTDLKGFTIPVKITGPLDDPKITPDFSGALKSLANQKLAEEKARLKAKLDKEKEEAKEKLKKKAAEKLKLDQESNGSIEDQLKDKLKESLFKKLF